MTERENMTSPSDLEFATATDIEIEQRILHDATLLRSGARVLAGTLHITDQQYEQLRAEGINSPASERLASIERINHDDYPVTLEDFKQYLEKVRQAIRDGQPRPTWNTNSTAGIATRAWNGVYQPRGWRDNLRASESMQNRNLRIVAVADEETGETYSALSWQSLSDAVTDETFDATPDWPGLQATQFVKDFVEARRDELVQEGISQLTEEDIVSSFEQ